MNTDRDRMVMQDAVLQREHVRRPPRRAGRGLFVVLCLTLVAACMSRPTPTSTPEPVSIEIAGSTAMAPLLNVLSQAFHAQHASVTMIVEPGNSYLGLRQVLGGGADLAALSVGPSDDLWTVPIALAGIAIVVHPDNPLDNLTLVQAHDVFAGRLWRWADVGIDWVGEIAVVSREEGSGTRLAFEALAMANTADVDCQPMLNVDPRASASGAVRTLGCSSDPVTPTAVVMPGSAAVIEYVASQPGAIGYVSSGYLSTQVKVVRVEGLLPEPAKIEEEGYPLVQPFILAAPQEPTGAVREFVDFCLGSEAQAIISERYVPVRE